MSVLELDNEIKEIEVLKAVLIKSKELLEQGEEVDFDDMMHIEILLEDACEVRELIEKTLNGKNMNKKPIQQEPDAYENTDKEIWREIPDDYYSPSIFVTDGNGIGIKVGGHVYVKSVRDWHKLAETHPKELSLTDEEI